MGMQANARCPCKCSQLDGDGFFFFLRGEDRQEIVPSRSSATETSRGSVMGTRFLRDVCVCDSLQVTAVLDGAWCLWCRQNPLARTSPPPPCRRAGSRDAEVPVAQERLLGRAPPPPPGLSWADAGLSHFLPGPPPSLLPLPQLPLPAAGLACAGSPRRRRGAWAFEDSTFCSLC